MNIVFAHDHIFYRTSDGKRYSNGGLSSEIWDRYLKVFDKIEVVSRGLDVNYDFIKTKNLTLASKDNVEFTQVQNLSSIKGKVLNQKRAKVILTEKIKNSDALIARVPSEIGYLAIEVAKELNKPWIVEVVSCAFDDLWNYGNLKGKLYAPISYLKMKKLVKQSPYAIYVSQKMLQTKYPTEGKQIGCSNVRLKYIDESIIEKRISKINDSSKVLTIGLIGAINNKRKGIDTALKSINILKDSYNIKLKILGGGDPSKWDSLINELDIRENVEFCGILPPGEQVYKWLDEIDIYIQPSFGEGLPRAIIEAMSRACPVIGSTVGAIPELISLEYMHKPGDYKKLAYLIKNLYEDKEKQKLISIENLDISKKYEEKYLTNIRTEFLNKFKEYTLNNINNSKESTK